MAGATRLRTRLLFGILWMMCFDISGSSRFGQAEIAQEGLPFPPSNQSTDPNKQITLPNVANGNFGASSGMNSIDAVLIDGGRTVDHGAAVGEVVPHQSLDGQLSPNSSETSQFKKLSSEGDVPEEGGSETKVDINKQEYQDCPCDEVYFFICTCNVTYGSMVYSANDNADITWSFDLGLTDVVVMVWFNRTDVSSDCSLTIGSVDVSDSDDLLYTTTVYMRTDQTVVFTAKKNDCTRMTLYYAAVEPVPEYETIPSDSTSGTIDFPSEALGTMGYGMQKRKKWTFSYSDSYTLELTITKLDLGRTSPVLHRNQLYNNFTQCDFLLVGMGEEILERTDVVLFGRSEEKRSIQINHPSAHIVFYGGYHEQYSSGFQIQYRATEVVLPPTTTAAPTTTPATVTTTIPSSWASLNGALNSNYSILNDSFLLAVATIATDYVNLTQLDVAPPTDINVSDVILHGVATCRREFCDLDSCAAFLFSINKLSSDGENWAFSTQVLDDMMRDSRLEHYWKIIDQGCEFCEESYSQNWFMIGGAALVVVLVGLIFSYAAFKIKARSAVENSKLICEADKRQEEQEKRRHSSGEVSMIGGVKGHRKIPLPFDSYRHSTATMDSEDEEEYDMGDFTEYDPDFGLEDYGLGSDLLHDSKTTSFYTNAAFEPDSPGPSGDRLEALEQHLHQPRQRQARFENVDEQTLDDDGDNHQQQHKHPISSTSRQPQVLKSSLKKTGAPVGVGASSTSGGTRMNLSEGLPKTSFRPDQKSSMKKITILKEEDEDEREAGVSSDSDDSDGAVQFQHTPGTPKTQQVHIQADVHSEDTESVL